MDLNEIIACLENTERREEFIARLKKAGETSSPVSHLKNAMTELNMHKAPKGIFETTMLQNMFRYTEPEECFHSLRLVCKPWKNAIETMRFDRCIGPKIFEDLDEAMTNYGTGMSINFFNKYLPVFKKLNLRLLTDLENKSKIFSLVLQTMTKLNYIRFWSYANIGEEEKHFVFELLKNSSQTLKYLKIPPRTIPNIILPQVQKLFIDIRGISLNEFKIKFPQILQNMESIKIVRMCLNHDSHSICEYIGEKYPQNCLAFDAGKIHEVLDLMPLKILEGIENLTNCLENKKYASTLEYAHMWVYAKHPNPMILGWDRYREIFDQCTNLKAIQFGRQKNFISDELPKLSNETQEIWKERISYFEARGIRFVGENEIYWNGELRHKLAKEAGITWRFDIY